MFEYTLTSNVSILTPFDCEFSDIKKEITQTPNCIKQVSTYPNGVIIESYQYANKAIIRCNKELIDNKDGTMSISL